MKVTCAACGKSFDAQRLSATFCGATCRKRGARPGAVVTLPTTAAADEAALVRQTRLELEQAEKLDTVVGQMAMRLAERMSSGLDTGSAMAAVSKEFRSVMAEALADVAKKADGIDELAARRFQKASGG